eukprot:gb/GFBE01056726.1/.p1 GENE.gb/GFBE01056726.1/~~gb/GFBE01056726.1/.p1  ORF type:complete len:1022 (+),score=226.29 gb/GFBE01056726.1/:1-3066(+)
MVVPRFQQLLTQLSVEHEKEIKALSQKNLKLKEQLNSLGCWDVDDAVEAEPDAGVAPFAGLPGERQARNSLKPITKRASIACVYERQTSAASTQSVESTANRHKKRHSKSPDIHDKEGKPKERRGSESNTEVEKNMLAIIPGSPMPPLSIEPPGIGENSKDSSKLPGPAPSVIPNSVVNEVPSEPESSRSALLKDGPERRTRRSCTFDEQKRESDNDIEIVHCARNGETVELVDDLVDEAAENGKPSAGKESKRPSVGSSSSGGSSAKRERHSIKKGWKSCDRASRCRQSQIVAAAAAAEEAKSSSSDSEDSDTKRLKNARKSMRIVDKIRKSMVADLAPQISGEESKESESEPLQIETFKNTSMAQRRTCILSSAPTFAEGDDRMTRHQLLQAWEVPDAFLSRQFTFARRQPRSTSKGKWDMSVEKARSRQAARSSRLKRILQKPMDFMGGDPNVARHFCWDVTSLLFLAVDMILMPLAVSFDTRSDNGVESLIMQVIVWLTTVFWTFDIIRGFFVGYRDKGDVVTDPDKVARHYLKSFFAVDFIICLSDWLYLVSPLRRILKPLLLLRLLRFIKLKPAVKVMEERIESEKMTVALRIAKQLGNISIMCHWIACSWWSLGVITAASHPSWVSFDGVRTLPVFQAYALALHWALTQFTPAPGVAEPHNIYERVFNIFTILAALIGFSVCFSSVTGALLDLRNSSSIKARQLWVLRKFLSSTGVSREVAVRVQVYCSYAWDTRNSYVQESNVQALGLLPGTLKAELRTAMYQPRMAKHAFFVLIHKAAPMTMQLICVNAVTTVNLASKDILFQSGQLAKLMFFVRSGAISYEIVILEDSDDESSDSCGSHSRSSASSSSSSSSSDSEASTEAEPLRAKLDQGEWLGEPVLWTDWVYMGSAYSSSQCEILALDTEKFQEVIQTSTHTRAEACLYAKAFLGELNTVPAKDYTDMFTCNHLDEIWTRLADEYKMELPTGVKDDAGEKAKDGLRSSLRSSIAGNPTQTTYMPRMSLFAGKDKKAPE